MLRILAEQYNYLSRIDFVESRALSVIPLASMLPMGVHIIAVPLNGLLLAAACIAADRLWGPGWRVLVVGVTAFLPAFLVAHSLAIPVFSLGQRLARWW